ncbi:hypothetical protein [Lacinutrix sp. Hel_I_90]|uniref:hypothetical protein n=1 Tax=Lacinutrix sp. Hel_I_90 TaxID=1249999 RepID=UPI0005CA3E7B|nr:hypothetical protein [Lacinutrix sp. Hel_I_90]
MKQGYLLFFLFTFIFNATYSQQSNTKNVRFNLGVVSKNVTAGIESYNLEDLKYHARICKDAIEVVEKLVVEEQCFNTLDLSNSIAIYLETALLAEELVTARTYLSKTENLILKAFYEYDICTTKEVSSEPSNYGENALNELQQQQADLKAQQAELEQKAKDIKLQLAEQEKKESLLKKQQFITSNERAITSSITAYNDLLKSCDCQSTISYSSESASVLTAKNLQEIKTYYLDMSISISQDYTSKLKACKE